jgi:hypothetical protein
MVLLLLPGHLQVRQRAERKHRQLMHRSWFVGFS